MTDDKKLLDIASLMGVNPSRLTLVESRVAPGWDPAVGELETPAPAEEAEEEVQRGE